MTSPGMTAPAVQSAVVPLQMFAYRNSKNKRGQQLYFMKRVGEPKDAVLMEGIAPNLADSTTTDKIMLSCAFLFFTALCGTLSGGIYLSFTFDIYEQ